MRIDIHISDATAQQLRAIAKLLSPLQKSNAPAQKSNEPVQKSNEPKPQGRRSWSKVAIKLANTKTKEAPYGIKMDGTPRKKPGRQQK